MKISPSFAPNKTNRSKWRKCKCTITSSKNNSVSYFQVSEDEVVVLDRLKGGMSNSNYVASSQRQHVHIPNSRQERRRIRRPRCRDRYARIDQRASTSTATRCFISNPPPVTKSVVTSRANRCYPRIPPSIIEEVAPVLRKLHQSGLVAKNDYAPFDRLANYERLVHSVGLSHDPTYYRHPRSFLRVQSRFARATKSPLPQRHATVEFHFRLRDGLVLVDWEFGGNNDPLLRHRLLRQFRFSIGFGAIAALSRPGTDAKHEVKRLYLWRTFQCLQWHNVALYKEAIGLSAELHLDFLQIARNYIAKANALFAGGAPSLM
ncbi:MAG: hypothetical protein MZU97_24435 [Bacillus subtilis]|nr:hypothetical protein [Bacillus subtilis]